MDLLFCAKTLFLWIYYGCSILDFKVFKLSKVQTEFNPGSIVAIFHSCSLQVCTEKRNCFEFSLLLFLSCAICLSTSLFDLPFYSHVHSVSWAERVISPRQANNRRTPSTVTRCLSTVQKSSGNCMFSHTHEKPWLKGSQSEAGICQSV